MMLYSYMNEGSVFHFPMLNIVEGVRVLPAGPTLDRLKKTNTKDLNKTKTIINCSKCGIKRNR